jgi:hypothetical protein
MNTKPRPSERPTTSRRAFLGTSALAVFVALVVDACGGNSSPKADTATSAPSGATTLKPAATTTVPAATTKAGATTSVGATTVAVTPATGVASALAATDEVRIAFEYVADTAGAPAPKPGGGGGGRGGLKNPYIAVWIEDEAGAEIRPISLNYSQRESRYLNELRRFSRAENARLDKGGKDLIATYSSATRQPGVYGVVWDGMTADGQPTPAGNYFLCIEASRERGPYSLIREAFTLDGTRSDKPLADQGELKNASAKIVAKA